MVLLVPYRICIDSIMCNMIILREAHLIKYTANWIGILLFIDFISLLYPASLWKDGRFLIIKKCSCYAGFTMYTTCVIWLAFVPLYFGTASHVPLRVTSMAVTISLSASVTLVCLFAPKVSLLLRVTASSLLITCLKVWKVKYPLFVESVGEWIVKLFIQN